MLIKRFETPGLAINSYLVYDEESRKGALIDPTRQIETYLAYTIQENIQILHILETHVHADFLSGAVELKAGLNGKPTIHCSGLGGSEWIPSYADHVVKNRDVISIGSLRLEALHTPGHTPEHIIWLAFDEKRSKTIPEVAFTGDLLFVGSVGRPDLLGLKFQDELTKQLHDSLFHVLQPLPDFLEIYPGHGAGSLCGKEIGMRETSTLGYEKSCNPLLAKQSFEQWQQRLLHGIPAVPKYFARMKRLNISGYSDGEFSQEMPLPLSKEQIRELHPKCLIVDVRTPEEFALSHIKEAINVPVGHAFPLWAGIAIPPEREIILVVETLRSAQPIIEKLRLIGIDRIVGVCAADKWAGRDMDPTLTTMPTIKPEQLKERLDQFYVLDVRTPAEWESGHIDNSHHIELTKVMDSLDQLPRSQPIAVLCRSGTRASIVTSLLNNAGFTQAMNIPGGITAWQKAGLKLTKT